MDFIFITIDIVSWPVKEMKYFSGNVKKTEILQKNFINAYPVSKCNNAHAWSCIYILDEGSGSLYGEFYWISKKLGIYISFCKTCIKGPIAIADKPFAGKKDTTTSS